LSLLYPDVVVAAAGVVVAIVSVGSVVALEVAAPKTAGVGKVGVVAEPAH
jgi:hypothetical protein